MKTMIIAALLLLSAAAPAQNKISPVAQTAQKCTSPAGAPNSKLEQDRAAILSMAGIYKVSFNFVETFSPDTGYKYHSRYREWGIEYVIVEEDSPNKIVLQHLLIINDTIIIKHWRQDWLYENREVYTYYKDNEWVKDHLSAEKAGGTWTQKVYQVDDSPRYESYGTWVHVDGKHYWEGTTDAPLPRREFTKRDDYNVLRRHSRMEIFADGWELNQDNEKIVRGNGIDKTICWEKGVERFTKGSYNAMPAKKWWATQRAYWADVRKVWDEVYRQQPELKLKTKVEDKRLYESLFDLGDKLSLTNTYERGAAYGDIRKIIQSFVKQS